MQVMMQLVDDVPKTTIDDSVPGEGDTAPTPEYPPRQLDAEYLRMHLRSGAILWVERVGWAYRRYVISTLQHTVHVGDHLDFVEHVEVAAPLVPSAFEALYANAMAMTEEMDVSFVVRDQPARVPEA